MTPVSRSITCLLLPFLFFLLLGGCAPTPFSELAINDRYILDEETESKEETIDLSCSYFYFLWGNHAENNKQYKEAQDAYEKALICDPGSQFILHKIPVLLIKVGEYKGAAQWLRKIITESPADVPNRLLLARLEVNNGNIEEAVQLYRDIIVLDPDDETVHLRLGVLYSRQNQYLEAEKNFKDALALNPESFFAHLYLARLNTQLREIDSAAIWYEKALLLNWSVDLALELAEFYSLFKKYERVESLYREVLTQDPDDEQAGLGLVHILLVQNQEKEALQELQRIRNISKDPIQTDMITSRILLRSGRLDEAARILSTIIPKDESFESSYMLAVIHYEQKNFAQVFDILQNIPSNSKVFQDSIFLQIRVLIEQNLEEEAVTLLKKILAADASNTPDLYGLLASLYMEQDRLQESHAVLQRALLEFPDSEQLHFEYGLLLEQEGKQELAILSMEKVLELEPNHAEALNYIGYTWADNNINLKKALQYIQRSIALKPDNGYIRDSLGWVYFRLGELDKAAQEILTALELEPDDPHIHEHLGDIYHKQEKKDEALKAYQRAEQLFVNQPKKLLLQNKINALQER